MSKQKQTKWAAPTRKDVMAFYKAWIRAMHTRGFKGQKLYKAVGRLRKFFPKDKIYGHCCLGVGLEVGIEKFPKLVRTSRRQLRTGYSWEASRCDIALLAGSHLMFGNNELGAERWNEIMNQIADANDDPNTGVGINDPWPIETIMQKLVPRGMKAELRSYYRGLKSKQT
jgi:hypothetical protein